MNIRLSQEIQASPEQIWPWLEDEEKSLQWMEGVIENKGTSPPPTRVGSTFSMKIKEGRKITDYLGQVTAIDRPRRMEVKLWGGGFPKGMEMFADYRLERVGMSVTRLDYECRCDPPGVFSRLMWLTLGRLFGRMVAKKFLRNLKRCVEGAPA